MVFGINGSLYVKNSDKDGIKPNMPGYYEVKTLNSCFVGTSRYASNPNKNTQEPSEKEKLYEKLANVKNPELRAELENILNGGNPSQAFMDMLIARYEKKQNEFELKWAQYQEAKGNMKSFKAVLEKLQTKYADSESNYENGLVRTAEKNYKNAELDADVLLSVASYLAHRVI